MTNTALIHCWDSQDVNVTIICEGWNDEGVGDLGSHHRLLLSWKIVTERPKTASIEDRNILFEDAAR